MISVFEDSVVWYNSVRELVNKDVVVVLLKDVVDSFDDRDVWIEVISELFKVDIWFDDKVEVSLKKEEDRLNDGNKVVDSIVDKVVGSIVNKVEEFWTMEVLVSPVVS